MARIIKIIILLLIFVALGGLGGFIYSFLSANNKVKPQEIVLIGSSTPTVKITPTPPTLVKQKNSNIHISQKAGVAFYYAESVGNNPVKVVEEDNNIYVYIDNKTTGYKSGQYAEIFPNALNNDLPQTVRNRFLGGIPPSECFVEEVKIQNRPGFTQVQIKYPLPANLTKPMEEYGKKCPEKYRNNEGLRYFLMDNERPQRYTFFDTGQYTIPSATGSLIPWQETLIFLK